MAAGRAAASSLDDLLMSEVLLRVKQELTTFNLAMREQCRQQLEAERSERIAALDEFREDCTNLRDDVRAFQVRQDKASNTIAQQRKDMESQLILLKDCLRENGGVCTEMADRLLSLQVSIEESQRNNVAPAQPDQCASVRAQSERDHWVGTLTNSARSSADLQAFTRELDEIKNSLLLEVQAARQVADDAVTADMLECKVQEILGPIQASMLMVTREIEGVVAAVDIAKRSFNAEEGPDATSVDGLKAQEDQARLLQENVRVLREMVPDGKKLKQLASQMDELRANSDIQLGLAMQVEELKGSISDMRRMNIQTCDFGNDLHTAFETFREELALRISSVETTQKNQEDCLRMKDDVDLNISGEEWKSQEPNVILDSCPPSVAVSCRETPATVTRTGAVHRLPSPGGPSGGRSGGPSPISLSLVTSPHASPLGSPKGSQSPGMIGRRPQRNSTGGLQVQKAMHSIGNYCSMRNAPGGSGNAPVVSGAPQRPVSPVPGRPLPPKQSQGNSWVPDRGRPQATSSPPAGGSGVLPVASRGASPERPMLSAVSRNARGISPERLSSGPTVAVSGGARPVGMLPGGTMNLPGPPYQMGNGAMAMTMGSSVSVGALPQPHNFQFAQQGAGAYQRSGSPVAGPMRHASTVLQTSGINGHAVQRSSSPIAQK